MVDLLLEYRWVGKFYKVEHLLFDALAVPQVLKVPFNLNYNECTLVHDFSIDHTHPLEKNNLPDP